MIRVHYLYPQGFRVAPSFTGDETCSMVLLNGEGELVLYATLVIRQVAKSECTIDAPKP